MQTNTTGDNNSAFGVLALDDNTTGSNNVGIGHSALRLNTTADNNTAVGYQAGYSNTTGTKNTYVGDLAGYTNSTSDGNTFIGRRAGYSTTGTSNTFIGHEATFNSGAGELVTTGSRNTIIGGYNGNQGGLDIRTSSNNIVLSDGDGNPKVYIDDAGAFKAAKNGIAASFNATSFHEFIGSGANSYEFMVLNYNATPLSQYITEISFKSASPDNSAAKFIQMRDSTTARVNINSDGDIQNHDNSYGAISDERIKQNIVDAGSQWEDIKNIRIRKYKKKDDVLQYGEENAPLELGVISQELESVSPALIKEDAPDSSHAQLHDDFTGENPDNVKYVKYSILYMKAVKALQEAMDRIETLEAKVATLESN